MSYNFIMFKCGISWGLESISPPPPHWIKPADTAFRISSVWSVSGGRLYWYYQQQQAVGYWLVCGRKLYLIASSTSSTSRLESSPLSIILIDSLTFWRHLWRQLKIRMSIMLTLSHPAVLRVLCCVWETAHISVHQSLWTLCKITFQVLRLSTFVFNKCSEENSHEYICG